jgi:hypothetical protein
VHILTKAVTPEGKVKQWCRKPGGAFDVFFPGHVRVSPRGGPFAQTGVADDILCWYGIFIAIEVKATINDRPTALQLKFLKDVISAGGVGAVLKGRDTSKLQVIRDRVLEKVDGLRR